LSHPTQGRLLQSLTFNLKILTGVVDIKGGMEIGFYLEEKFQKVNLNVIREATNGYLF